MRIVVSGTHASGKSTLISDFVPTERSFVTFPDPFDLIDEDDPAGAESFVAQLRVSAARLLDRAANDDVIAERGPLDFLAYLDALDTLGRASVSRESFARCADLAARAMSKVDLLVVLPLEARNRITVARDEDPELRDAMEGSLLELVDDADLVSAARVVEIAGDRGERVQRLREVVTQFGGASVHHPPQ